MEEEIKSGNHKTLPNGTAIVENTFWMDFSIADAFGAGAVEDTYKRAFDAWKEDMAYMTALSITLNHKIYQHFGGKLGRLYDRLWKEIDHYILDYDYDEKTDTEKYKHFTKKEVEYYVRATD